MKKKIYIWCSDNSKKNGEGVLANKFIDDLIKYNKKNSFKVVTLSLKNINFFRKIFGNLADRFFFPVFGVFYLWFVFIFKKKKKICFVNYLPLWNFLLFAILPPKTILGPITGGSTYLNKPFFNYLVRDKILNLFCDLSVKIIKFRQSKLLFSTNLLEKKFPHFKKNNYNYVFKDFIFKDKNIKRNFDIIFYLRSHKNKNTNLLISLAKNLSRDFKVVTVGERIIDKNIINKGNINKKQLFNILQRTKYSLISSENIYSLFSLDCLSNGVIVFYNKKTNPIKIISKNMIPVNYENSKTLYKKISTQLKKIYKKPNKIQLMKKNEFETYFKI